ncbi:MAG TPA: hypothetical protein VFP30_06925 [Candidatus Limnocylindria bacterium]|nr:hypothetical protein [Candidatus Limnocylindria bacterium]
MPLVALLPVILIPLIAMAANSPAITVTGTLQPGGSITVTATNLERREWAEVRLDGQPTAWLATTKTDRQGTMQVSGVIPPTTAAGTHTVEVWMKRQGRASRVEGAPVARATITIGAVARATAVPTAVPAQTPAAGPATPVPATPAPVVQPTVAPTRSPATPPPATPAPTPRPTTAPTPAPLPPQPAPAVTGAIGYGAATVGGAGGRTIAVTTLADSGTGSLRAALEADGPRVIVFSVGGTITLRDSLKIDSPYVTIAGETAPSPVVIRGGGTLIVTHDVVVRHLRFRPGDAVANPAEVDALTINGMSGTVYNVIVDHTSMIWGPDIGGLAVLGDVRNVTVSNSIMGEGLYLSRHPEATAAEGGHSHAANLTQLDGGSAWPRRISMVGNLFTTADSRVPRLQGAECVDLVNNVIYNWGTRSAHGNPRSLNLVNNYYRFGPESRTTDIWDIQTSAVAPNPFGAVVYSAGNRADGFVPTQANGGSAAAGSARCGGLSVGAASADVAYASVLAAAGATLPSRDAVDARIISNVKGRTGTFFNGAGAPAPNPY